MNHKVLSCIRGFFIILVFFSWTAAAGLEPPSEGERLPAFTLPVPEDPDHRDYLGLSGKGSFTISDIRAEVVILEIFSMY